MHTLIRQDHTKATPSKNPILVRTTLGSDHKDKKKSQNHTRKYNSKLLYVKKHTLINTTINQKKKTTCNLSYFHFNWKLPINPDTLINKKNHQQSKLFAFQLKF